MKDLMVVFYGKRNAGKTFYAKELRRALCGEFKLKDTIVCSLNFADYLKREASHYLGWDITKLEEVKNNCPPIRAFLQAWGDWRKETDGKFYFADKLQEEFFDMHLSGFNNILINSDARFPEELGRVLPYFSAGMILVHVIDTTGNTPAAPASVAYHASETSHEKFIPHFTIKNDKASLDIHTLNLIIEEIKTRLNYVSPTQQ